MANQLGITIYFDDGGIKYEAFISHKPKSVLKRGFLAAQLGLQLTPQGSLQASPPFRNKSGQMFCGRRMYGQKSLRESMQMMVQKKESARARTLSSESRLWHEQTQVYDVPSLAMSRWMNQNRHPRD
ncbi:hypothetical protein F5Y16DRAFT_402211 [Xylariaceae sp. FL0255]|nr:hypothetical protein F5Y16DRAFT_402211 [Xylariaceae sp. FL0255]